MIDSIEIRKEDFPAIISNILTQSKQAYPKEDMIHKLNIDDFDGISIIFFKKVDE